MARVISKLLDRFGKSREANELGYLTRLVRRYAVEQQQVPRSLLDLVTLKYLKAVPVAPPGQKFVIDRKAVEVRLEN